MITGSPVRHLNDELMSSKRRRQARMCWKSNLTGHVGTGAWGDESEIMEKVAQANKRQDASCEYWIERETIR